MKKFKSILTILIVMAMIFSVTACGGGKEAQSEDFDAKSLKGIYVSQKFFDSLAETKSVKDSMQFGWTIWVDEDEETGKDAMMIGDLHQGGPLYVLSDTAFDDDKKEHVLTYNITTPNDAMGDAVTFTYSPENEKYHLKGNFTTETMIDDDMKKIGGQGDIGDVIAYELLKDSPDVTIKEEKVFVNVDGEECRIYIPGDALAGSEDELKMFEGGALGFAGLVKDETADELLYYFVEDGNMVIKDAGENVILTLAM